MQITLMTFAADELERVLHNISMPLLHSEASFVSLAYLFLKPPPPTSLSLWSESIVLMRFRKLILIEIKIKLDIIKVSL